jgi:hypothetical protein
MNTQPNDGGPAFPCHTNPLPGKLANAPQGMTLRDYFAGQALQGAAHRLNNPHEHRDILASDCYEIADAMLAARERKEGDQ